MQFEILYKKLLFYSCRKSISLVDSLIFLCKTHEGQGKQIQKPSHFSYLLYVKFDKSKLIYLLNYS